MTGYQTVPLGECARVVGGATPKTSVSSFWGGDVNWVTPKDISALPNQFLDNTPRKITKVGLRSCSAEILPVGSVLLSSRAPIGLVAINRIPTATNQGFKSLITGNRLDAGFLYWWFRINRPYLESLGNGATFKEVSKAVIERIEIPLPPLNEQRRIASILDKADEIRRKRMRIIKLTDLLLKSIFLEMFGDPGQNPHRWLVMTIGDLAKSTQNK